MTNASLQYYILICDKKRKRKFHELMANHGAVCIQIVYGKGSAKAGAFAEALGFDTEEHKVVISGLIPTQNARELTQLLKTEHDFAKKNTGIAFSIGVEGLSL